MSKLTISKKSLALPMAIIVTVAMLSSVVGSAIAQESRVAPGRDVPPALSQGQGPADPAELEAFLDALMAKDMEEGHIPGAAVSVVKDGLLFFAKGYGYADLENQIPVDAEQTAFATGSVGKLFTWTAVMQLVEQGKLDLDADVNTYLDFRIPDTYPQPITLKHLLTHTAGFEELWFEVFAWDPEDQRPAGEWLGSHIPARVSPPGQAAAYSNYGAMLAGYIVARASGLPYEQYVQEYIFDPLGMKHSAAQLPPPPDLRAHTSLGYWDVEGDPQPVPTLSEDYFGQAAMIPAGGHVSSVTDVARFMIMHLQGGLYGDASTTMRILEEATVQRMHRVSFSSDPRILGTALGFFDYTDNGQRTIGHSGGTLGFATLLLLVPDQNLGVYVVYNHNDAGKLTTQHIGFQRAFFDHYYPAPEIEPIQPPTDFEERADRFVGLYRSTRAPYTTFEKFGLIMRSPMEISDLGDGTLLMKLYGIEMRLVEVEPLHFRLVDSPLGFVFREDDRGRITHMVADLSPEETYAKLDWYEIADFNLALLIGCAVVFLSMLPVALVHAIRNRRRRGDREPDPRGARAATWILVAICVLNLLFLLGVARMVTGMGFPMFGISSLDTAVFGLGVVSALLTIGALVGAAQAWIRGYWGVAYRSYYTLVTIAAVAFVWFLNNWNLLGWRF